MFTIINGIFFYINVPVFIKNSHKYMTFIIKLTQEHISFLQNIMKYNHKQQSISSSSV